LRVEWAAELRSWRGQLLHGGARGAMVHAASFPRSRRIVLDTALRADAAELRRITVHELFHFAWVRLSNAQRAAWRDVLEREARQHARGELGWSAEQYKLRWAERGARGGARAWREYSCESFCDTAAWLYAVAGGHSEFTLAARFRAPRRQWFEQLLAARGGVIRI
jgi:hypothetical protein